jgi:hypothetical protein
MNLKALKFLAKSVCLALLASVMTVSPAQATNCSSVTGTSLGQTSNLWIFQWDALTDTTNVDALNVFVTSGSGSQSWYNYADGRYWDAVPSSATSLLTNKRGLIDFMNEQEITEITCVVIRMDAWPTIPRTVSKVSPSAAQCSASLQFRNSPNEYWREAEKVASPS